MLLKSGLAGQRPAGTKNGSGTQAPDDDWSACGVTVVA